MESVNGTARVIGVSPEVMEKDPGLGTRISGTTLHYEGFETAGEVVGWVGSFEVTVTAEGMYVETIHANTEAARDAASARASA